MPMPLHHQQASLQAEARWPAHRTDPPLVAIASSDAFTACGSRQTAPAFGVGVEVGSHMLRLQTKKRASFERLQNAVGATRTERGRRLGESRGGGSGDPWSPAKLFGMFTPPSQPPPPPPRREAASAPACSHPNAGHLPGQLGGSAAEALSEGKGKPLGGLGGLVRKLSFDRSSKKAVATPVTPVGGKLRLQQTRGKAPAQDPPQHIFEGIARLVEQLTKLGSDAGGRDAEQDAEDFEAS